MDTTFEFRGFRSLVCVLNCKLLLKENINVDKQKKILTMIMLLIVVAPLLLYTVYLVKQKLIQHQMLESLESSSLQIVSINSIDFKWEKANKEVIINGELFDVKSFEMKDGKVILKGLYDVEEKKLKNNYAKLFHQKNDNPSPLDKLLLKFIFATAILRNTIYTNWFSCFTKPSYFNYSQNLLTTISVVYTPPPNSWFL